PISVLGRRRPLRPDPRDPVAAAAALHGLGAPGPLGLAHPAAAPAPPGPTSAEGPALRRAAQAGRQVDLAAAPPTRGSRASATPSSSLEATTQAATCLRAGLALPMAMGSPTAPSRPRSFWPSPTAAVSASGIPRRPASLAMASALSTPARVTSR